MPTTKKEKEAPVAYENVGTQDIHLILDADSRKVTVIAAGETSAPIVLPPERKRWLVDEYKCLVPVGGAARRDDNEGDDKVEVRVEA